MNTGIIISKETLKKISCLLYFNIITVSSQLLYQKIIYIYTFLLMIVTVIIIVLYQL